MIRIGKILIDPDSIDTILKETKVPISDKDRGYHHIQIIYKSGVVKNMRSDEIGMSYDDFINEFEKVANKAEDRKMFKVMAAINSTK